MGSLPGGRIFALQLEEDTETWVPPPRFDGKKSEAKQVDVTRSKNLDQQEYLSMLEARKHKVGKQAGPGQGQGNQNQAGVTNALRMLAT